MKNKKPDVPALGMEREKYKSELKVWLKKDGRAKEMRVCRLSEQVHNEL